MTRQEAIRLFQTTIKCIDPITNKQTRVTDWNIAQLVEMSQLAINALEKQEKYKWHDLRDNPNDIPKNYDIPEDRLIILKTTSKGIPYIPILRDMLKPDIDTNSIIAWKEIEPFEEERK